MKNITLDRATVLQLDPDGTDRALDAAANCDVLRNDAALNLCALADQEIRGAQLALDSAKDLRRTIAFDVADDRHTGADARACRRIRRRLSPRRGLFNNRLLLLHRPFHDFCRICRRVLILLRCLTLEATQHVHLPFSSASTAGKGQGCLLAFERELAQSLFLPTWGDPQVRTPFENRTAQKRAATLRRYGHRIQCQGKHLSGAIVKNGGSTANADHRRQREARCSPVSVAGRPQFTCVVLSSSCVGPNASAVRLFQPSLPAGDRWRESGGRFHAELL